MANIRQPENSIMLTVEILFTNTGATPGDEAKKQIAEKVLNALVREVGNGDGLAPDDAEYVTEHIYVSDYMTGREIALIHTFPPQTSFP